MKKIILVLVALVMIVWIGYWLTNSSSPQAKKGCKIETGCCGYSCVAEETETKRGGGCIMFCPRPDYSWQICGKNSDGQCGWRMSFMGEIAEVFKEPINWIIRQRGF